MNERKPVVWIVNEAGHPYEKALTLIPDAELKPLTLGNINPLQTDRVAWHISQGIARYAREEDYLLISGTPAISFIAGALWILRFGKAKILQWNALRREYILSTIEREHLRNLLEKEMLI